MKLSLRPRANGAATQRSPTRWPSAHRPCWPWAGIRARQRISRRLARSSPRSRSVSSRTVSKSSVLAAESDLLRRADPRAAVAAANGRSKSSSSAVIDCVCRSSSATRQGEYRIGPAADARTRVGPGIEAFDEERAPAVRRGRISALDESWQLFDTVVQLAIRAARLSTRVCAGRTGANAHAERTRRLPLCRPCARSQRALAADEAIVALNQFDDELAVWVIRQHGHSRFHRPMSRRDAARFIARQQ